MRWGTYAMTWVRPLRSIISLLDELFYPLMWKTPTSLLEKVPMVTDSVPKNLSVKNFEDYKEHLLTQYVVVDPLERSQKLTIKFMPFVPKIRERRPDLW